MTNEQLDEEIARAELCDEATFPGDFVRATFAELKALRAVAEAAIEMLSKVRWSFEDVDVTITYSLKEAVTAWRELEKK